MRQRQESQNPATDGDDRANADGNHGVVPLAGKSKSGDGDGDANGYGNGNGKDYRSRERQSRSSTITLMTTTGKKKAIDVAVALTIAEDYLRALTLFLEIYGNEEPSDVSSQKFAKGLSYFGLTLALVQKEYRTAIELCKRAIQLQFYEPDHYANLALVYLAAGQRKKAIEIAEQGLKEHEDHPRLLEARKAIGIRARPALPFLDRSNPVNVALGQKRHAKELRDKEKKP
ncbi:MAG TPA: tetratricopeptide repeat protein [Thermoanaerobaculia bacterium]|nr:tetratricopeptide repeat protein [Thermoanaerobaculia bacterium]